MNMIHLGRGFTPLFVLCHTLSFAYFGRRLERDLSQSDLLIYNACRNKIWPCQLLNEIDTDWYIMHAVVHIHTCICTMMYRATLATLGIAVTSHMDSWSCWLHSVLTHTHTHTNKQTNKQTHTSTAVSINTGTLTLGSLQHVWDMKTTLFLAIWTWQFSRGGWGWDHVRWQRLSKRAWCSPSCD